MKITKIQGHIIAMYDSIEEAPIVRYHNFSKMLLIDSGIGGDVDAVMAHMRSIFDHVARGDNEAMVSELENYHQSLVFIVENISPTFMAFSSIVKSVDGIQHEDISEQGARRLLEEFKEEPVGIFRALISAFKKKTDEEIETYFPALTSSGVLKEYYAQLNKRTLLTARLINGEDVVSEIEKVDEELWRMSPPQSFAGHKGAEAQYQLRFEYMSAVMSQRINKDPKKMTAMEFYQTYLMLKKQEIKDK